MSENWLGAEGIKLSIRNNVHEGDLLETNKNDGIDALKLTHNPDSGRDRNIRSKTKHMDIRGGGDKQLPSDAPKSSYA